MDRPKTSPVEYYEKHNLLFKPLNILKRNAQRLEKTTPRDTINELLKNAIEHGNGNIKIKYTMEKGDNLQNLVVFNTVDKDKLDQINFNTILDKLTTFQHSSETNFHEGLTTLLLFHCCIKVKIYLIQNKQSEDNYYQYIEKASHYIDEAGIERPIENSTFVNGWEVTVFQPNFTQAKLLDECLTAFYFVNGFNINIYINNEAYKPPRFATDKTFYAIDMQGRFFYDLFFDPKSNGEITVFWRLNNEKVFQKIPNTQFNGRKVSGRIILTTIHHFANENRIEVSSSIDNYIDQKIQEILKEHKAELEYSESLESYEEYFNEYSKFFQNILEISPQNIVHLFQQEPKEESMVIGTDLVYTLHEILRLNRDYTKSMPKLLQPPNRAPKILDARVFQKKLEILGCPLFKFRDIYKNLPVGLKILNGDPDGFLFANEIPMFMYGQRILQIVDPSVPFQELLYFENDVPIIYPIHNYIEHIIADLNSRYIKSALEFRRYPVFQIKNIIQLRDFGIAPDPKKKQLQSKIQPKTESDQIKELEIKEMNATKVEFKGIIFELSIFQIQDGRHSWKIPLLFNRALFSEIHQKFFDEPSYRKDVQGLYRIFSYAIELLIRNSDFPAKTIYPAFFYEPKGDTALYLRDNGVVCYNIWQLPPIENNFALIGHILDIAAHELAHEYAPNHGRIHEQKFESFLWIAKNKDKNSGKYIVDLMITELNNSF